MKRGRAYRHQEKRANSTSSMVDTPREQKNQNPVACSTPNVKPPLRRGDMPRQAWNIPEDETINDIPEDTDHYRFLWKS